MNFPTIPTLEEALRSDFIYEYHKLHVEYPTRPTKPSKFLATADDFRAYAILLEDYEAKMVDYRAALDVVQSHNGVVDLRTEQWIQEMSGLNSIPEQYRRKVWEKAWSDGHSGGYNEVYNHLCDLIAIFE